MKRPWKKTFEPFDKAIIEVSVSRSKPRLWYSWYRNPKDHSKHNRNIHLFSFTKVRYQRTKLQAYRLIVGPFMITAGW